MRSGLIFITDVEFGHIGLNLSAIDIITDEDGKAVIKTTGQTIIKTVEDYSEVMRRIKNAEPGGQLW